MMVFTKPSAGIALLFTSLTLVNATGDLIMAGLQPIAYERVDPILRPGSVGSNVNAIVGPSSFDQNANYNSLRSGRCTSAPTQQIDMSAYWAPSVHYQNQTTKEFTLIPVTFTIQYIFGANVRAFPAGFKMTAGSPTRGTYNASNFADQAVNFVCVDFSGVVSGNPAFAPRQDINFPDVNACEDGIRCQIVFPQCWDGVNLDSADHKSHMAYPVDSFDGTSCPSSHPVHTAELFFEVTIPTADYPYWGSGAYVFSSGDPTGLGFYGDFQNGWDASILQEVIDVCSNTHGDISSCPVLAPSVNDAQASACTLDAEIVNEDVVGPIPQLPGCNPVQVPTGSRPSCPNQPAPPGFVPSRPPLPSGWTDVGCIAEGTNGRALTGASTSSSNMSLAFCAGFCHTGGFSMAGVEFGSECICGNSFSNGVSSSTVPWEQCNTACSGDPMYSNCGGPQFFELLQFASGSSAVSVP